MPALQQMLGSFQTVESDITAGDVSAVQSDCADGQLKVAELRDQLLPTPWDDVTVALTPALDDFYDGFAACVGGDYSTASTKFISGAGAMSRATSLVRAHT